MKLSTGWVASQKITMLSPRAGLSSEAEMTTKKSGREVGVGKTETEGEEEETGGEERGTEETRVRRGDSEIRETEETRVRREDSEERETEEIRVGCGD